MYAASAYLDDLSRVEKMLGAPRACQSWSKTLPAKRPIKTANICRSCLTPDERGFAQKDAKITNIQSPLALKSKCLRLAAKKVNK